MRFLPPDSNIPRIFLNSTYRVVCAAVHTTRVTSRECRSPQLSATTLFGSSSFLVQCSNPRNPEVSCLQRDRDSSIAFCKNPTCLPRHSINCLACITIASAMRSGCTKNEEEPLMWQLTFGFGHQPGRPPLAGWRVIQYYPQRGVGYHRRGNVLAPAKGRITGNADVNPAEPGEGVGRSAPREAPGASDRAGLQSCSGVER